MSRAQALIAAVAWIVASTLPPTMQAQHRSFQKAGEEALEWTRRLVELGPRPPASQAHRKQQRLIRGELSRLSADVGEASFTAKTPRGPMRMTNLIARFRGRSDRVIIVSGHYDTFDRLDLHFVGANDGGSSAGFLLALGKLLAARDLEDSVWLVFFDGEESLRDWNRNDDNTYGSRHQIKVWKGDGTAQRLKALINVDMIGDADLDLVYEGYSTPWLRDLVWRTARGLRYETAFSTSDTRYVEDDHVPFVRAGLNAVNLIDFNYGPRNSYWHTEEDTIDKLSAASFAVVLHVVSEVLNELAEMQRSQ